MQFRTTLKVYMKQMHNILQAGYEAIDSSILISWYRPGVAGYYFVQDKESALIQLTYFFQLLLDFNCLIIERSNVLDETIAQTDAP